MKASVILLLAAMCCGGALFSQTYAEIDTNNIRVGFNHSGDMLTNLNGGSGLSAPTSGNTISFSVANLWLGGLDAGGQLHVAAQTYRQVGTDFWPGPLDTINACSFSSDVVASGMNRLWEITQAEIDAFVYCMNTSTSGCPVPQSILDWPGNGNQFYNQGIHLAPFHDADGDGVYNPSAGDYPVIRGDKAVYFIYNDANCALTHGETQGQRLSVEIHGLAYAYDCADSALANTVFIHYRIINRSTHTYNSTYIGHWSDIDLGTFSDDRVGSDSLLHAYYFYDGGDDAWGAVFLNQPMSRAMSYANNFTGTGNPSTADDYYELLRSIYPDGTPLTYNSMSTPTTHIFTGDPYLQTGWLDSPTSPASAYSAAPGRSHWPRAPGSNWIWLTFLHATTRTRRTKARRSSASACRIYATIMQATPRPATPTSHTLQCKRRLPLCFASTPFPQAKRSASSPMKISGSSRCATRSAAS